jgi:hypothetical protein
VIPLHVDRNYALTIAGIAAVIPLDLALLLAIAMPFGGDLQVDAHPFARVLANLAGGRYGPL